MVMMIVILALRESVTEQLQVLWQSDSRQKLHLFRLLLRYLRLFLYRCHSIPSSPCVKILIVYYPKLGTVPFYDLEAEYPLACWSLIWIHSYQPLEHLVKFITVHPRYLRVDPFKHLFEQPIHVARPERWLQCSDLI